MNKVIIIAEAGVNHNGSPIIAKQLIDVAAEAGADYVKFQTFKAGKLVTKSAPRAEYQDANTKNTDSQYEMLQKLELSEADHLELMEYCKTKNIKFLSTGFDLDSVKFLSDIGITLAKIPSGEITNLPYLEKVAELYTEIILSTGMANMQEVKDAYQILINAGIKPSEITILHCNTEYPTPMEDVNLKAMLHIEKELKTAIGYSDHTLGIEVPIAAVALGAKVIEKHFTLDRELPGPDHRASLEPEELKAMVMAIRNIEMAISGSGIKEPSLSESKNKALGRKSIVAIKRILKGDILTRANISVKRPGNGISPMKWNEIIGEKAIRNFDEDEMIDL